VAQVEHLDQVVTQELQVQAVTQELQVLLVQAEHQALLVTLEHRVLLEHLVEQAQAVLQAQAVSRPFILEQLLQ
jgi:hypothetical protein